LQVELERSMVRRGRGITTLDEVFRVSKKTE